MFVITNGKSYLCSDYCKGYNCKFLNSKKKANKYDTIELAEEVLDKMHYRGACLNFKVEPYAI